jgi:deoxyadenosine/deoxycytidine kinase
MTKFVDVEGVIGAGKTTLVKRLTTEYDIEAVYEPVKDNPFLEKYYEDPERYGFTIQMWLMAKRNHANNAGWHLSRAGVNVAIDRGRLGDRVFAVVNNRMHNITDDEMRVYDAFFEDMNTHDPDVIVFLDIDEEEAMRRIASRGRDCEKGIDPDYLHMLRIEHQAMVDEAGDRGVNILRNPTIAEIAAACGLDRVG